MKATFEFMTTAAAKGIFIFASVFAVHTSSETAQTSENDAKMNHPLIQSVIIHGLAAGEDCDVNEKITQ